MGKINIQFQEVDRQTIQIQNQIEAMLDTVDREYHNLMSELQTYDGANTPALLKSVAQNRQKAQAVGRTLNKLLGFIDQSSKRVEEQERRKAISLKGGVS